MMVNNLVGGIPTPLKNMNVNGKDAHMEKQNVPNHQPVQILQNNKFKFRNLQRYVSKLSITCPCTNDQISILASKNTVEQTPQIFP